MFFYVKSNAKIKEKLLKNGYLFMSKHVEWTNCKFDIVKMDGNTNLQIKNKTERQTEGG
jgi:hypothetical protein